MDWSRDPVFGDEAQRVGAHSTSGARIGWPPEAERATVCVLVRDGSLSDDVRAALGERCPAPFQVIGRRGEIAPLVSAHPSLGCVLAASDHALTPPRVPRLMGVVNVTPDSFSDGGSFFDAARAIEHGVKLASDGADFLDVGGESTRPGSTPIDAEEEMRRVLPVVRGLRGRTSATISIDTTKSEVAEAALDAGATIVNDVSAGTFDARILAVTARAGAAYVAMHMQGKPGDMQRAPRYVDLVGEVLDFLRARCRAALEAGIERSKLWVDPGIGFGKTLEHNLALLRRLNELRSLGLPVLLGVSRKSFIAAIEERAGATRSDATQRLGGTLAALTIGVQNGAEILRVHDVREARQAALVARQLASLADMRASCGTPPDS